MNTRSHVIGQPTFNAQRLCAVLIAAAALFGPCWNSANAQTPTKTGIQLVGANDKEKPYLWTVTNVKTNKQAAYRRGKWGTVELPPGEYDVAVKWRRYSMPVKWQRVTVAAGKTTTVSIRSGITLSGRSEKDTAPREWTVYDVKTNKKVGYAYKRWGFLPLPPGKYRIVVKKTHYGTPIPWAEVTVKKNQIETVQVRSGVVLKGRSDNDPAPREWYVFQAGTDKKLGYAYKRWGYIPLPAGKYRIAVKKSYYGVRVPWKTITVRDGQVETVAVDSGVELSGRNKDDNPPYQWFVYDATGKKKVGYAYKRWGFVPLTAGNYKIQVKIGGVTLNGPVTIAAGKVRKLSLEDLGARHITVELPAAKNVRLATGGAKLAVEIVQGKKTIPLKLKEGPQTKRVSRLVPFTGRVNVRFRVGSKTMEIPVTLEKGRDNVVPFDAEAIARRNNLSLFQVDFGTDRNSSENRRLIVMDSTGKYLLLIDDAPAADVRYLAPANPKLRLRKGKVEVRRSNLPTGRLTTVTFQPPKVSKKTGKPKINVDIVIQSPKDGTIVRGQRVKLIGRASTTGPAGATRVAIIIDVSGSAKDSSGADIDGDGKPDSILQAEVAAARLLIRELKKVEDGGPGTAFAVTVLRFGSKGEVMAPLTPMTQPNAVGQLNKALDRVLKEGTRGSTNFESAVDTALKVFEKAKQSGPSVILMMTDGAPSAGSRGPVPSSLDAASRAGLTGTTMHMIGLGKAFLGKISPKVGFPPQPKGGVNILATMKDAGAPGGTVTPLPKPADVVKVVAHLPVLNLPEAKLKEVQVVNTTINRPAFSVKLEKDGSFVADVPVSLLPSGKHRWNTLQATAIAMDGVSQATAKVRVRGVELKATLQVVTNDGKVPQGLLPAVEIVYDSSGSMKKKLGRAPKYLIARLQTLQLLKEMPSNRRVGLRMFGHRGVWILRKTNPNAPRIGWKDPRINTDTELVVPIRRLTDSHRENIRKWLNWAKPQGKTPLVLSLLKAKNDFPATGTGQRTIVLISDGMETCGGDLNDVKKAYRGTNIDRVIHVVGFDVKGTPAEKQLKSIARIGGGKYYSATNAGQLIRALTKAVDSTGYTVWDSAEKRIVARGVLNGSSVTLKPGRYQVKLNGSSGKPVAVRLGNGQNVKLTVDDKGTINVPRPEWKKLLSTGLSHRRAGRLDAAIASYTKALQLNPQAPVLWNNRGFAYFSRKDYRKAVDDFRQALELNPRYVVSMKNLGRAYIALSDIDLITLPVVSGV